MKLLKPLIAIVVCLSLSVVVYAHPGRTDSNGGHTNHSTGEYHYHHGYSEHQHYDMDGNGTLDCPYNFDDKTGSSSSSGKITKDSSKSSTKTEQSPKTTPKSTVKAEPPTKKSTSSDISAIEEFLMILACIAGFLAVPVVVSWLLLLIKRIFLWLFRR